MKFNRHLSFNIVDTSFQRRGNRIIVETGMLKRCDAIVRLMKDLNFRGISDIREAISGHYKYADLYAAASRLRSIGVLRHNGYGRWQMVLRGEEIWNDLCPPRNHAKTIKRQVARIAKAG